jgi:hypothetical protein
MNYRHLVTHCGAVTDRRWYGGRRCFPGQPRAIKPICGDTKSLKENIMTHMSRLFATLSAVAVMSGMLGASTVHAANHAVFPATGCVHVSGADSTPWYGPAGQVFNQGTTTMYVRCPTVRHQLSGSWSQVQVVAIDESPDADVRCRAVSASHDGTASRKSSYGSTAGNHSTGQVINLTPPEGYDSGSYMIECWIPPQNSNGIHSGVASYHIVEPVIVE